MKKHLIFLLFICLSTSVFSQENKPSTKDISGKITYLNAPLSNVNIIIKGTNKGTKTNVQGNYSIKANVGDMLKFSYVGFNTVSIIVEDITTILNIKMDSNVNELDEVVVNSRKKVEKTSDLNEVLNVDIETSLGTINPIKSGYAVHYLDNKSLSRIASPSLEDALNGRFSRVEKVGDKLFIRGAAARFDIDGQIYERDPGIIFSNIEHLYIIKNKALVIIRTKNAPEEIKKRQEAKEEKYRNQNYYNNDAATTNGESKFSSINLIKNISGKVTYLNAPVPNVNITIKGTSKGTKTNNKGEYHLQANVGDILEYSHVSYKTLAVMIEDVTSVLNIEMTEKANQLDEVVVKARVDQKALEFEKKMNVELKTPFGNFNPKKSGFSIKYIDGNSLNKAAPNIASALNGKVAGLTLIGLTELYFQNDPFRPAIYVVDGQKINSPSLISLDNIVDIYTITNKNLIIIRTINSLDVIKEKREDIAKQYQNQNYYNDDAVTTTKETTFSSANIATSQPKYIVTKYIHGKVTYIDSPLVNVNIIIVGKTTGTKTNNLGKYTIKAVVGDIIQYSHLGFATVSIIVEDVTEILNIEMVIKVNKLAEVTVTADGNIGKVMEQAKKANETFETSMGTLNPKRSGVAMAFVDGENLSNIYSSISEALDGKISGVRYDYKNKRLIVKPPSSINTPVYPIWDIDGVIYDDEPPMMNLDNVKSIRILKTLAGTNRYGSAGAGGVIVVQTKTRDFNPDKAKRKKIAEQYTNKNYYSNDASVINLDDLSSNSFADALEAFNSKQKAFIYYDQTLKKMVNSYSDNISIAQKFVTHYKDINLSKQVLNDLAIINNKNTEVLKAIAYQFQTLGLKRETIKIYESIFKLRPKYAQSYRDLANAYLENDQYKKAWRMYMSYLLQGNDVSGEGIGQILYNEMEFLYYNRRRQTDIRETFIPKSENLFDFRNDVRLVFEWNTSEAEFDLEFVNQEKRAYLFEHSLMTNQELITNEKQKGYSSKEFFIDDIGEGEWLVNITYKGNKKPEPTYFKVTQYFNWGKANQTQEIAVYKFQNEREKIQLIKLNKQLLVATN